VADLCRQLEAGECELARALETESARAGAELRALLELG
jgi:hypothetical protein